MKRKLGVATVASLTTIVLLATAAGAQDAAEVQANLDNIWVFIAGILVFLMQAGFGLVEAGLTRAKNVANIMAKNLADMAVGALAFGPLVTGSPLTAEISCSVPATSFWKDSVRATSTASTPATRRSFSRSYSQLRRSPLLRVPWRNEPRSRAT